jgi:hypothetical protein
VKTLVVLLFILSASPAFAQAAASTNASAVAPGCGPAKGRFDVRSYTAKHPIAQPRDGKAIVYLLQDDKYFYSHPRPTVKWGVDGQWAVATQANDYAYYYVDPGEHQLCAQWQTSITAAKGSVLGAYDFAAKSGQSYYFRALDTNPELIDESAAVKLESVGSDEAAVLMNKFGYSTSRLKK